MGGTEDRVNPDQGGSPTRTDAKDLTRSARTPCDSNRRIHRHDRPLSIRISDPDPESRILNPRPRSP